MEVELRICLDSLPTYLQAETTSKLQGDLPNTTNSTMTNQLFFYFNYVNSSHYTGPKESKTKKPSNYMHRKQI